MVRSPSDRQSPSPSWWHCSDDLTADLVKKWEYIFLILLYCFSQYIFLWKMHCSFLRRVPCARTGDANDSRFSALWDTLYNMYIFEMSDLLNNLPEMRRHLIDNMRSYEIIYISVERIIYQGQNRRNPATQSYRACKMAASCSWDRSIWWIGCFFV